MPKILEREESMHERAIVFKVPLCPIVKTTVPVVLYCEHNAVASYLDFETLWVL